MTREGREKHHHRFALVADEYLREILSLTEPCHPSFALPVQERNNALSHEVKEVMMTRSKMHITVLFCLLSLIAVRPAYADCKVRDIERELSSGGWTFESRGKDSDGDNVFRLVKDGTIAMLYAEPDGDLMFRSYYEAEHRLSDLNKINRKYRYLKAYRDDDDDIVFGADVASWDDSCPYDISKYTRLFFSLLESAESDLP